jgi:DNA-directed RNA polymerase specialized sigma24 family protein
VGEVAVRAAVDSGIEPAGCPDTLDMSGDSQATPEKRPSFDEVYRSELSWVWHFLLRLGVPDRMVDDAAQDVFLVVLRRLPEYEPRDRLRGWLGAIAWKVAARIRGARRDRLR